jgi:predicted transposase YdaD
MERGRKEGMEMAKVNIAKTALMQGLSINIINKITDLDLETIKSEPVLKIV